MASREISYMYMYEKQIGDININSQERIGTIDMRYDEDACHFCFYFSEKSEALFIKRI